MTCLERDWRLHCFGLQTTTYFLVVWFGGDMNEDMVTAASFFLLYLCCVEIPDMHM